MADEQRPSDSATTDNSRLSAYGWLGLGLAALAGVVAIAVGSGSDKAITAPENGSPLRGSVTKLETPRKTDVAEACDEQGKDCRPATEGLRLQPGARLRTSSGARATITLENGIVVALERSTTVALGTKKGEGLRLEQGTIVVDMSDSSPGALSVEAAEGNATLERAKCTILTAPNQTQFEVIRGHVELRDRKDFRSTLSAGETGTLRNDRGPWVERARNLGEIIANGEPPDAFVASDVTTPGLGELRAKKPGETQERANAVRLARHHVRVRVVGAVAKTEIEEVFTNETSDVLEGIFRFPLPADAQIERLALDVDGRLVEGAFTERERASAIWRGNIVNAAPQMRQQLQDEIVWVPGPWKDPALLEWQRGNRFELRIFPIPKQGSRRIILSYTQLVPGTAGQRRYSYPLPQQSSQSSDIDDFAFELQLRGHVPQSTPVIRGYEGRLERTASDVSRFALEERRFLPRGELQLDYELPNGDKELVAWAHQPSASSEGAYVAMLLRPKLPSSKQQRARDYAFVVDTSRSMFGESRKRAMAVTTRMIAELSSDDRVVVLACDSGCRKWPEGLVQAGATAAERAQRFLDAETAEGASDVTGALEAALVTLGRDNEHAQQVVYVGDGTPTAGPTRPATLAREVKRLFANRGSRLTAVAVGTDSDLQTLRTLAAASRGLVVPYVPGTNVAKAAYAALGATFAPVLTDAKIELPEGISAVTPTQLDTLASGEELLLAGRMLGSIARGDVVLRGRVDDQPFEQRYPVELRPASGEANAFVPRLYAAARITDLERRGDDQAKTEAVLLSRNFSVASRYTSLLVLESQAMFRAFGLDNQRKAEQWTGELDDSQTASDVEGEEQFEASTTGSAPGGAGLGASGGGRASPSKASAAPREEAEMAADEAPAPAAPTAAIAKRRAPFDDSAWQDDKEPRPRQRMIPMRRIWERKGEILVGKTVPAGVSFDKTAKAERDLAEKPDHRTATKQLFDLYFKGGELDKATTLAERWSERDPLDVEALIARADLAARRGDRPMAIRILGSVVDVRPSDFGAQQRLSRLYRWQGSNASSCRFSLALAEFRPNDEKALADALRCLQTTGRQELALELRHLATERVRRAAEALLAQSLPLDTLQGDLRITATWNGTGDVDLDLSLIDPDAHRVSWLGAPTRSVITATGVLSHREEGLALRGAKPGEYLIELTRGAGQGTVQGTLTVSVAGATRQIPFTFDGERLTLGVAKIAMVSRLVPVEGW